MEEVFEYFYNDNKAIVIVPENANGEWLWKTEFLYAFDQAERALLADGYTRVYYSVSDRFGSYGAIRAMHQFHLDVVQKFNLSMKAHLLGFSRGGLYAFNYAITYPEYVKSIYLDAPVLDLKSWPPKGTPDYDMLLEEYCLSPETLEKFKGNPVDLLEEFSYLDLPLLLVAGDADTVVPLSENGQILIDYFNSIGNPFEMYIKPGCEHHPHSLEDVTPIVDFIKRNS